MFGLVEIQQSTGLPALSVEEEEGEGERGQGEGVREGDTSYKRSTVNICVSPLCLSEYIAYLYT